MPSTLYFSLLPALNLKSSCILFTCLFLWYLDPTKIRERRCKSSISWIIGAYKLVCLLGIILKKDQETWLLACISAMFWDVCYSTRLYCLGHSFKGLLPYYELASKVGRGKDSAGKRPWGFGTWKIVLSRFLTLSGDLSLFHKTSKCDIHNWAWKMCC